MQNVIVIVIMVYVGVDFDIIVGFVIILLENVIVQVNGIDYMILISQMGVSMIIVNFCFNYDLGKVLMEISIKVNLVLNQLFMGVQQFILSFKVGQMFDVMYFGFFSMVIDLNQVIDYFICVVQLKFQVINGV